MFPARIPASRQQVQLLDQWLTQTLQELRVAAAAAGCPSVTFGEPDDDGDGGTRDKASALGLRLGLGLGRVRVLTYPDPYPDPEANPLMDGSHPQRETPPTGHQLRHRHLLRRGLHPRVVWSTDTPRTPEKSPVA